jgi:rRNA-processing protein CGR1
VSFLASKSNSASRKAGQETSARILEDRKTAKAEAKEKREEKQRRRAENELRTAQYQVISDPAKLKKMSKRQLRQVKRTTVNAKGQMELVPAYS